MTMVPLHFPVMHHYWYFRLAYTKKIKVSSLYQR